MYTNGTCLFAHVCVYILLCIRVCVIVCNDTVILRIFTSFANPPAIIHPYFHYNTSRQ